MSLSTDAPNNDLAASPLTPTPYHVQTVCGYSVGSYTFSDTVTAVHDGDTIAVGPYKVRLDSIDAPELTQTYGQESRKALADRVLGKKVMVAYAKQDKYGRRVGAVFASDCTLVNLEQVRIGAAWYYEAYKCEIGAETRNDYARAQAYAQENDIGLWAKPATAPWYYRNGIEAEIPSCTSSAPTWPAAAGAGSGTGSGTGSGAGTTAPATNTCTMVWVNGYTRANGTRVQGYWRRKPGC